MTWEIVDDGFLAKVSSQTTLEKLWIESGLKEGELNLSEDLIFDHALFFLKKHNRWPTSSSRDVETMPGEKWSRWFQNLSQGVRGFPVGGSLPQLIKNRVIEQARKFKESAGRLPTREDGPLPDYPDVTWEMVDGGFFANKGARTTLENVLVNGFEKSNHLSEAPKEP